MRNAIFGGEGTVGEDNRGSGIFRIGRTGGGLWDWIDGWCSGASECDFQCGKEENKQEDQEVEIPSTRLAAGGALGRVAEAEGVKNGFDESFGRIERPSVVVAGGERF